MLYKELNESFDAGNAITAISKNYWHNYKENCYVDESVKSTLSYLSKKFKCGILSNFMLKPLMCICGNISMVDIWARIEVEIM